MNPLATYLGQVILVSGLCYAYYWAALRGGRFHRWNRVYLVAATALSLVIPLVRWSWFFPRTASAGALAVVQLKVFTFRAGAAAPSTGHWLTWLWVAYGLVAAGILARGIAAILSIRALIRRGVVETRDGYRMVLTDGATGPFSFFHYVFWGGGPRPEDPAAAPMLRHEIVHARQGHSVDKLCMEVAIALVWVNPFFYLIRRELHLVHEFLADESACGGRNAPGYAELLVSQALRARPYLLTNAFFPGQLHRRVHMLVGEHRSGGSRWKRALSIPFVVAVLGFVLIQQGGRAEGSLLVKGHPLISAGKNALNLPAADTVSGAASLRAISVAGYSSSSRTKELPPPPPPPSPRPPEKDATASATTPGSEKIFSFVEQMPSFPGGEGALMQYLSSHIHYPASARENGYQGTVVVQFEVETDGSLRDVSAMNAKGYTALAAEAARVVKGMPRWNPGRQNGHKVVVRYSLPVRFVLQ